VPALLADADKVFMTSTIEAPSIPETGLPWPSRPFDTVIDRVDRALCA
jgi:hypothetical protein